VLRYTKGVASSTKRLINHLKSKHKIQVIIESEDHNPIPAQKETRSKIVITEMSLFEATKKRSNHLEKLYHTLLTNKPTSVDPERASSAIGVGAGKFSRVRRSFAQISQNLLENDLQKKRLYFISLQIKPLQAPFLPKFFVSFLQKQSTYSNFAKVFTNFVRIFSKPKVSGVRLHPRLLHQCPQAKDYLSQNSVTHWMIRVCFDCHASVLQTSLKLCA